MKDFWMAAVDQWIHMYTEEDKLKIHVMIDELGRDAGSKRQEERSIVDEIMFGSEEDEDD